MKTFFLFLLIGFSLNTIAQTEDGTAKEEQVFTIVEVMPEFPGGEKELIKYLSTIKYPAIARENDIEGTVFIRFIIDQKGQVTNVESIRSSDPFLSEAALEHIKGMPVWKPGTQRGKNVSVYYTVPIRFKLNGKEPAKENPQPEE